MIGSDRRNENRVAASRSSRSPRAIVIVAPENVDYGTLSDAVRLSEAVVRRLDERWL